MNKAYGEEVARTREALACGSFDACFSHLERGHVLAQRMAGRHTHVRWLMLVAGWRQRDYREVVGQVPRVLASIVSRDCQGWITPSMGSPSGRLRAIC